MNRVLALACAFAGLALAVTSPPLAQNWPRQAVKIVVTFPPGGAADMLSRAISAKMADNIGQSVVIENRPGAAGNVGITVVARAPADGYTLGVGTLSTLAINPALSQTLPFDARKDFIPIAKMVDLPIVLATPAQLPAKDFAGLIDYARKKDFMRITLLTDRLNAEAQRFYKRHGFFESAMLPMRFVLSADAGTHAPKQARL